MTVSVKTSKIILRSVNRPEESVRLWQVKLCLFMFNFVTVVSWVRFSDTWNRQILIRWPTRWFPESYLPCKISSKSVKIWPWLWVGTDWQTEASDLIICPV